MSKQQTLRRKLFLARKAAEAVEKHGRSEDGGYKFATHADVLAEASKHLEKQGILVVPSMVDKSLVFDKHGNGAIATVTIEYEVIDSQGTEAFKVQWSGTGYDNPGDKAIFKATTGAAKYFFANLLGIPFGSDPEETASSKPTAAATRPDAGDGPGMLVLRDLAWRLKAIGAPAETEDIEKLLTHCGIKYEPGDVLIGLVPATREEGESVHFEIERMKQDAEGEAPDVVPPREKPLPETDLPEPDYAGLQKAEGVAVDA